MKIKSELKVKEIASVKASVNKDLKKNDPDEPVEFVSKKRKIVENPPKHD